MQIPHKIDMLEVTKERAMDSEFTYEVLIYREEGYISVVAKGNISLESLNQMYSSVLRNPKYESGMSRLWDFTHLDVSLLTSDHLNSFLQYLKNEDLGIDSAYSAILVRENLEFGIVRMLQGLGYGILSPNVLVTKSQDEALAWVTKQSTGDVRK